MAAGPKMSTQFNSGGGLKTVWCLGVATWQTRSVATQQATVTQKFSAVGRTTTARRQSNAAGGDSSENWFAFWSHRKSIQDRVRHPLW